MKLQLPPYLTILTMFTVFATPIFMTACKPSEGWFEKPKGEWQDISDSGLPKLTSRLPRLEREELSGAVQSVSIDRSADLAAERMGESLKINQARIAADYNDKCPKLISTHVDSNIIERKHEVLQGDYCDYYVYPSKGQTIHVQSEPDNIEAYLVSPVMHDFTNGGYYVKQADKYVIRLDYNGIEYQNNPIDYDVTVTIE